jgi:TetR/AcrR family transcriptional regulator
VGAPRDARKRYDSCPVAARDRSSELIAMPRTKTAKRRPATTKLKPAGVWYDVLPNRSEQREMKREALLRAAVSAFNRRGFAQTSLDEIAQNLGVTKAALYYYFPTKSALVAACFDRAMKVADDALAIAKRDGRDGRQKLMMMLQRYLKTVTGELNESLLLTEEQALTPSDRGKLIEKRDAFERELRAVVKEGIRDGSIVTCDPKLAIFVVLGAIHWVPKWFSLQGPWTDAQVAVAIGEMLDRMLSTSPAKQLAENVGDIRSEE